MKVAIDRIKVAERIRKEVKHVPELADDINKNGLLQSIIVMPSGEDFKLLAGLRRLKAVQSLGWTEIEANVLPPKDAETALRIEISENEQREPFTFSEKAYYGKLLEDVEKAKAAERERAGVKIDKGNPSTHGHKGRATENVGAALGISGTHYERIIVYSASVCMLAKLAGASMRRLCLLKCCTVSFSEARYSEGITV
ncbi:hypothetical protein FACS189425_03480 [Clostridia bacterium]|nr:hypothetical protein FACS189425_03480 [Clostridia bacterium]